MWFIYQTNIASTEKSFIIVVLSFYYSKKKNNDGNDGAFNQVAPIMKRALPPTQKPIQAWTKWRFIYKQYTCIIRNKVKKKDNYGLFFPF